MDILIPLGKGSRWQDNELRYALRGVEKHISGYDKIFVIGEKPEWLTGVIHIPFTEIQDSKQRAFNIYSKVAAGCRDERLSNDFFFMSDDHFLLQSFYIDEFPFFCKGDLKDSLGLNPIRMPYVNVLINTYQYLIGVRRDTHDYNLHCPIIYNKEKLLLTPFPHKWPEFGFVLKSYYCNYHRVQPRMEQPDLKITEPWDKERIYQAISGRLFFSIGNSCLSGGIKTVLQELYPSPSKYEL